MTSLALGPMHGAPPSDPGGKASLLLAVAVHLLLFAFLFFGVNWNTQQPAPVMAELWSQLPNVQPPPPQPQPEPEPPKPVVKVEPPPPPKPLPKVETPPKPDIALEREKERLKKEAEMKAEAEKKKREETEKLRRETAEAERKRLLAQLNEVPTAPSAPIKGPTTQGDPRVLTATYQDRVRAAVKQKINYVPGPEVTGNPTAEVQVQQMPTGEVLNVRILKPSGVKLYDEALERAIRSASPLPKPENEAPVPRELTLKFKLNE